MLETKKVSAGFIFPFLLGASAAQLGYSALTAVGISAIIGTSYPLLFSQQLINMGIVTSGAQSLFGLSVEVGSSAAGYLFYKTNNENIGN